MKQFNIPNTSLKKEELPTTTQSNIRPNTSLKYSKTNMLNISLKREYRKESSMISTWNISLKKEFRKESSTRQLKDKSYTHLKSKSNRSNTYNSHKSNTSNNQFNNTPQLFHRSNTFSHRSNTFSHRSNTFSHRSNTFNLSTNINLKYHSFKDNHPSSTYKELVEPYLPLAQYHQVCQ